MADDPLARTLSAVAPIADERILAVIAEFEGRSIMELEDELGRAHERLRTWAAQPGNAGRPVSECPEHLTRIALGALIERRLFAE